MNKQNRQINLVANSFSTQFKNFYYYTNTSQNIPVNTNIMTKYLIDNY